MINKKEKTVLVKCTFRFLTMLILFPGMVLAEQPPEVQRVIVHAGHVIIEAGLAPLHEQSITIENGRFTAIEPGYMDISGAVNLRNAWVMPGLIDTHTHVTLLISSREGPRELPIINARLERQSKTVLQAQAYARSMLAKGFTTVRNLGDPAGVLFDLRDAINEGLVQGPRIFGTEAQIVVSGGDYDPATFSSYGDEVLALMDDRGVCDGVNDCRRAVRQEIRRGADVIKLRISGAGTGLGPNAMYESPEELKSIIDTAHALNRTVAVHSHSPRGTAMALELGADTIEHGLPSPENFKLFDDSDGQIAYFIPTLTAYEAVREMMPELTGADWYAMITGQLKTAYDAGVPIAFGSDAGAFFPHAQAVREFSLMAEAGISNVDILRSATINAAAAMKQSENLGNIAPGKWGDLVATHGNPLEDISELERIIFVMKAGEIFSTKK